jgi:hypothetical protein
MTMKWNPTSRIETTSGRPGSGSSELVMEEGGVIRTKKEFDAGVPGTAVRYRRLDDGRLTSHGSLTPGFEYRADENPAEWSQW